MFIKIYFNDKPLFLCDHPTEEIRAFAHHDDAVFINELSTPAVNSMIHEMRQAKVHAGIFAHPDLEALKKAIWKKFIVIQAGGGLVRNAAGKYLFMLRRGIWDLPKGKLDEGETIEECAVREVEEETGVRGLRLENWLLTTYHTYDEHGKHILKETYWYLMTTSGEGSLQPQTEEQITELQWLGADELQAVIANTFPSILDVLKTGGLIK